MGQIAIWALAGSGSTAFLPQFLGTPDSVQVEPALGIGAVDRPTGAAQSPCRRPTR
jgi:hypothetical protein